MSAEPVALRGPDLFAGPPLALDHSGAALEFPHHALPRFARDMVAAVAEATQTDPAMAGVTILSVLAGAVGAAVDVVARPGWVEPCSLYTCVVAAPGERKSSVHRLVTEPLYAVERELADASRDVHTRRATEKAIAEKRAERAATTAISTGDASDVDAASAAKMAAESIEVPPLARLVADDITPEAVGAVLVEQGSLAIISTEGGIFDTINGRYSNGIPNLDVFLKGHSGDPLRVDRRGRGPEFAERPILTVGLMVQPAVLAQLGQSPAFRGRGLTARFLFAMPPSRVGFRNSAALPVSTEVSAAYSARVKALAREYAAAKSSVRTLGLSGAASEVLCNLQDQTEARLRRGGLLELIPDWGGKLVGATLRIAALIHLADPTTAMEPQINAKTLQQASQIGEYFVREALRAFDEMNADQEMADARYVWQRIEALGVERISERQILREAGRIRTMAALRPSLLILSEREFIAALPMPERTGPGRRPSQLYAINRTRAPFPAPTETTQRHPGASSVVSVDSVDSVDAPDIQQTAAWRAW